MLTQDTWICSHILFVAPIHQHFTQKQKYQICREQNTAEAIVAIILQAFERSEIQEHAGHVWTPMGIDHIPSILYIIGSC